MRCGVHCARYDELVQSIDIVPTVLTAAGLSSDTKGLPGVDLLPFAMGKATLPDRPAFGEIFPNDAQRFGDPEAEVDYLWVREGNLKLIQNVRPDKKSGSAEPRFRLYDLSKDPGEKHDLAAAADRAEGVKRLEGLLRNWWPAGASGHAKEATRP